eukprot:g6180.t1
MFCCGRRRRRADSIREDFSSSESMEMMLNGNEGAQRLPFIRNSLSISFKTFLEAFNPQVSFHKRNNDDVILSARPREVMSANMARELSMKGPKAILSFKDTRTRTPNGHHRSRRFPLRSGHPSRYLFRSLADITRRE